ncbi:hypothetical protein HDU85_003162 [Gaertneriomyces sp. JEL0708]|nr:hypothetical protein HDU85_003162 [Gaertneriomyces sp. JEL0708]
MSRRASQRSRNSGSQSPVKSAPSAAISVDDEEDSPGEETYEVERILSHKVKNGVELYLVKWKGWGDEDNTWEPVENLEGAEDALREFWKRNKRVHGGGKVVKKAGKREAHGTHEEARSKRARVDNGAGDAEEAGSTDDRGASEDLVLETDAYTQHDELPESKLALSSWDDLVERVDTLDRESSTNGIIVFLTWKDGTKSVHPNTECNARCPQAMIQFYEKNVRFRTLEEDDAEAAAEETYAGEVDASLVDLPEEVPEPINVAEGNANGVTDVADEPIELSLMQVINQAN